MNISRIAIAALASVMLLMSSCAAPNLAYFQDSRDGQVLEMLKTQKIKLKPQDKISIVVNSRDPELADLFNLPIVSHRVGYSNVSSSLSQSQQVSCYTIDAAGNVDFPILGEIHIAGLTREEVADKIKSELLDQNLIKDPVVIVEFANMSISVLGEVRNPGRYNIDRDDVTLLQALGLAGDMTIYGVRENILVQRIDGNKIRNYRVDITNMEQLTQSPAFHLQQNDVVYVSPNDKRRRESTVNGNNVLSTSFWISIATLAATVASMVIRFKGN
ncbi:MAG: polysaccharide biosynthesis/export family protein [Bacteroidales bacterium]|nr:polysaccharide biosynthesis/export family protein [Bacteroidales bacterium]